MERHGTSADFRTVADTGCSAVFTMKSSDGTRLRQRDAAHWVPRFSSFASFTTHHALKTSKL